jgi:hypothetical protein
MNTKIVLLPILLILLLSCSKDETENNIKHEYLYPISVNHKYGYIDKTGKIVVEPQFDYAVNFKEGLALVLVGEKWGFINTNGDIVIEPKYDLAFPFTEGVAHVVIDNKDRLINKNGTDIFSAKFESIDYIKVGLLHSKKIVNMEFLIKMGI